MATEQCSRSFYRVENTKQSPNIASRSTREMFPSGGVRQSGRHQCPQGLGNAGIPQQRSHRRPCPVHHTSRKLRAPSLVSRELKFGKQKFPSDQDFSGITRQLQGMFTSKAGTYKQSEVEKIADLTDEIWLNNEGEHGFSDEKHLAAGEQAAKKYELPGLPGKRRSTSLPKSPRGLMTVEGNQYEPLSTHSRQTQTKPMMIPTTHDVPIASKGRPEYMNIAPHNRPESMDRNYKIPSENEEYGEINTSGPVAYNSEYTPKPLDGQGYVFENRKVAPRNDYFRERLENDHCYNSRNKNVSFKNNDQYYNFEDRNEHLKVNPCQPPDSRNWNYSRSNFGDSRIDQCQDCGNKYIDSMTHHQHFNHFGNKTIDPGMHNQSSSVRDRNEYPKIGQFNAGKQNFDFRFEHDYNFGEKNEVTRSGQYQNFENKNIFTKTNQQSNDLGDRNEDSKIDRSHGIENKNVDFRTKESHNFENSNDESKSRNGESKTGKSKKFQDNSRNVEVMSNNFITDKYHDFQSKNTVGEPETTQQMTNNEEDYAECSPEINPVCQKLTSDICKPETKTCPPVKVTNSDVQDTISIKKTRKPKMNVCLKLVKNKNDELSVVKDDSCGCCNH